MKARCDDRLCYASMRARRPSQRHHLRQGSVACCCIFFLFLLYSAFTSIFINGQQQYQQHLLFPSYTCKAPKIFDMILFNGEIDMLRFRYKTLDPVVDLFILVESNVTFSGKEKALDFGRYRHQFRDFEDKIRYIVVDDVPNKGDAWENEAFQRNAGMRGLQQHPALDDKDLVIISDVDEVPDPRTLLALKQHKSLNGVYCFDMDMYYYNFHFKKRRRWREAQIVDARTLLSDPSLTPQALRSHKHPCQPLPLRGGWHMSYFGNVEFIQKKLNSFSHQEYNNARFNDRDKIQEALTTGKDLYGRDDAERLDRIEIENNDYLPFHYELLMPKRRR